MMRVLSKKRVIQKLAPGVPAAYAIAPGEVVVVETRDAMDGQIPAEGVCVAEVDSSRANPLTGPIDIAGAKAGQTLAVRIQDIQVDAQGWMSRSPSGLVNAVRGSRVEFMPGVELPIAPMIGCVGVRPDVASYTGKDVTRWGGNFDIRVVGAGATVFLPVATEGAGLVLGDVHALQADGECSGTGVEIGAEITLQTHVLDHGLSDWPYLYRDGVLSAIGVDEDLRVACQIAAENLARIVQGASDLSLDQAKMFLSLMADVHVGQFVCPIQSAYISLDLARCPWPIDIGLEG